jgi:DICT domain-containing protein
MMASMELSVNFVACEEEEEEGYMNLATGERHYEDDDEWRMPNYSRLELEPEEEIIQADHINVIMEEVNNKEEESELYTGEAGSDEEVENQVSGAGGKEEKGRGK